MTGRRSTGKRLRFEVFKRDRFTCQYCGAQPPDVVLVADHIEPFVIGGATSIDNLITACEACNQGKADCALANRQMRPDADLLFLETAQEMAELQRYQRARAQRDALVAKIAADLCGVWLQITVKNFYPTSTDVEDIIRRFGPEIAEETIRATAMRVRDGRMPWVQNLHGYLIGVAKNLSGER